MNITQLSPSVVQAGAGIGSSGKPPLTLYQNVQVLNAPGSTTETVIDSYTVKGNTLATDKDMLEVEFSGTMDILNVLDTITFTLYLDGSAGSTTFFGTNSGLSSTSIGWSVRVKAVRGASGTLYYSVSYQDGTSGAIYIKGSQRGGSQSVTLTSDFTIKLTEISTNISSSTGVRIAIASVKANLQ